ncbi:WxL domain-containing protein [Lactococcus nasutitermitis]|uniref:WxL domain-containing protein n=1 Tax=Lactococcus nasutitermitis TaxID=1652957 RepID=A0ABV9JEB4_9LACT|nr:WxL domain-containing protein [Lactococcus nasutitermitis]
MNKLILKSATVLTAALIIAPTLATTVSADTAASYNSSANVTFAAGTASTTPVDPTDPSTPATPTNPDGTDPEPGTAGPLSIDFASSLSFGTQVISASDQTYYAHAQTLTDSTTGPNYVQVTDTRGTLSGWSLSVNTDAQLHLATVDPTSTPETSDTTPGDYLTGATISFSGGYVAGTATTGTPTGTTGTYTVGADATTIMNAAANQGAGTWVYGLGAGVSGTTNDVLGANNAAYQENGGAPLANSDVSTASPITLSVPGTTAKKAAAYTTDLIWTLSDTPAN